jgi:hypothetical protein
MLIDKSKTTQKFKGALPMHIQFLKDYRDADSSELLGRKDERAHVPQSVGENLIFRKVAQRVAYRSYVERLSEESKLRTAAKPIPVEWGIKESDGSQFSVNTVVKKSSAGTIFYSAPPDDAPAEIKRRFAAIASIDPNCAATALAIAKNDAAEQRLRESTIKFPWE